MDTQPNVTENVVDQTVEKNIIPNNPGKTKGIIISVLVLLIILGGVAFAYFFVSSNSQKIVNDSIIKLTNKIESNGYSEGTASLQIKVSGVANKSMPSVKSTGEANLVFSVKSDLKSKKASENVSFTAEASSGGMTIKIDGTNLVDLVMSGSSFFVRLNKIPTGAELFTASVKPEIDMVNNEIVGKWIRIDSNGISKLTGMDLATIEKSYSSAYQNIDASTTDALMKVFRDSEIFKITQNLPSETINGSEASHYKIVVSKDGLVNFSLKLAKIYPELASKSAVSPQIPSEQEIRDGIDKAFTAYQQSGVKGDIDLWVEKGSGVLVKIGINIDASGVAQFQQMGVDSATFVSSVAYDFPQTLSITEPESSMGLSDLIAKLGLSSTVKAKTLRK